MAFVDLSDPNAVLRAVEEFDTLGRDRFLEKYQFGRAKSYFLVLNGRRYDSKAIAGVAHGYQFPGKGPLKPSEFSGGENTVAQKFEQMGFHVTRPGQRAYWAFCANPKRYRVLEAVELLEIDWWTTSGKDIRAGDQAIIWQTTDQNRRRGVVALAEVLSDPEVRSDADNPFWCTPGDGATPEWRVPVRYWTMERFPLWVGSSSWNDVLDRLSVNRARGGTVFHVTAEQWQAVELAGGQSEEEPIEVAEAMAAVRNKPAVPRARRGGQGFGSLSAAQKRAVEMRAMECATQYLTRSWPSVRDVSKNFSCDLLCERGDEKLYVEVKGTITGGESVILTRNEVRLSQQFPYALFVVSEIVLGSTPSGEPEASGGKCHLFDPWREEEHQLEPITYNCKLDFARGALAVLGPGSQ